MSGQVVVAMSGGVDSSAAALMLHEQGYQVIGVSMQVWDYRKNGGSLKRATCCAPADFDDARTIADAKGFPFYVFDFEEHFTKNVIQPFVEAYLAGKTPNPCVECNRKVKFHELRDRARTLGIPTVATGHYSQVKNNNRNTLGLFTARDKTKDQSYFLYSLRGEELCHTMFPVGQYSKPEVREYLNVQGFSIASKPESQDICFVSSSVPEFVEKVSGKKREPGKFISSQGTVLGMHEGIHHYTVGQRRGLGLSAGNPLYVLEIDSENDQVVVGEKSELSRKGFLVKDIHWIHGSSCEQKTFLAKLRYRHEGILCQIKEETDEGIEFEFLNSWTPVSPGQSVVFYSEEPDSEGDYEVFGGGILS